MQNNVNLFLLILCLMMYFERVVTVVKAPDFGFKVEIFSVQDLWPVFIILSACAFTLFISSLQWPWVHEDENTMGCYTISQMRLKKA